jgi:Ca-activated chloride channel homolog
VSFVHPRWLLVALLVCALLAWLYRAVEKRRDGQALAYSNLDFATGAMRPSRWPSAALFGAWLVGVGALAVAIAGPRFDARVPAREATVVVCIDTSGSMRAEDLKPNRSDAAKAAARSFIDAVPPGTRIGLVSFSSGASVILPPTADLDVARQAIEKIPPPNGATAIGDALAVAAGQMPAKGTRAIVLLTDGVNNRGIDPVSAAQQIGARGITISTVGVGTANSGELIPGTNEMADLDETSLQSIAGYGHGRYARAGDSEGLSQEFRKLALETVWEKRHIDGRFPVALGGGMLVLATFLAGLALGRFP